MEENQMEDQELDQEVEPEEDHEPERNYEEEAKQQGWVPKDKYKNPDKWVDAKEFIERGEIFRPALNAKYKEAETKNAELERRIAEQDAAIERANKISEKLLEQAKQETLAKIKADQKTAWEQGDDARYNELDKRRDNIAEEFKIEPVKPREVAQNHPAVSKFEQENPWYGQDMILTKNANDLDAALIATGKYTSVEARHAEVKRQIIEAFPHKFENPNRNKPNGLGGGRNPAKSSSKKGWDAMPEADKRMASGFLKGGKSKEDYAAEYWKMIKEEENA